MWRWVGKTKRRNQSMGVSCRCFIGPGVRRPPPPQNNTFNFQQLTHIHPDVCARSVVRATLLGMLTVYRRHFRRCPHTSRHERRCQCPIAVEGTLNGEGMRKSLGLRSLESAQKLVCEWEGRGAVHETPGLKLRELCDRFFTGCEARKLGTE